VKPGPRGDFADRKTPVVAGVERDRRVKACVVPHLNGDSLAEQVTRMVHPDAHLQTDHAKAYKTIGVGFARYERVRHSRSTAHTPQ